MKDITKQQAGCQPFSKEGVEALFAEGKYCETSEAQQLCGGALKAVRRLAKEHCSDDYGNHIYESDLKYIAQNIGTDKAEALCIAMGWELPTRKTNTAPSAPPPPPKKAPPPPPKEITPSAPKNQVLPRKGDILGIYDPTQKNAKPYHFYHPDSLAVCVSEPSRRLEQKERELLCLDDTATQEQKKQKHDLKLTFALFCKHTALGRTKELTRNALTTTLMLDIDTGNHDMEVITSALSACGDFAYMMHTSASSTQENQKWHVFIPLAEGVPQSVEREEYQRIEGIFADHGITLDNCMKASTQGMFEPVFYEGYQYKNNTDSPLLRIAVKHEDSPRKTHTAPSTALGEVEDWYHVIAERIVTKESNIWNELLAEYLEGADGYWSNPEGTGAGAQIKLIDDGCKIHNYGGSDAQIGTMTLGGGKGASLCDVMCAVHGGTPSEWLDEHKDLLSEDEQACWQKDNSYDAKLARTLSKAGVSLAVVDDAGGDHAGGVDAEGVDADFKQMLYEIVNYAQNLTLPVRQLSAEGAEVAEVAEGAGLSQFLDIKHIFKAWNNTVVIGNKYGILDDRSGFVKQFTQQQVFMKGLLRQAYGSFLKSGAYARYSKKALEDAHKTLVTIFDNHLTFRRIVETVNTQTDIWATDAKMLVRDGSAYVISPHQPFTPRKINEAHLRALKLHYEALDTIIELVIASRFAGDRKQANFIIHAPSNAGKDFLMSAFNNLYRVGDRSMGVVQMTMKELKAAYSGNTSQKTSSDFTRALVLQINEVNYLPSELKNLDNYITFNEKYKAQAVVPLYAKFLTFAERFEDLKAQEQLGNRLSVIPFPQKSIEALVIVEDGVKHKFSERKSALHETLCNYVAQESNTLIDKYLALGKAGAKNLAGLTLSEYNISNSIRETYGTTADELDNLCEDIKGVTKRWAKNPLSVQNDGIGWYEHLLVVKHLGHDAVVLQRPKKLIEKYIKHNYPTNEIVKYLRQTSKILEMLDEAPENKSGKLQVYCKDVDTGIVERSGKMGVLIYYDNSNPVSTQSHSVPTEPAPSKVH